MTSTSLPLRISSRLPKQHWRRHHNGSFLNYAGTEFLNSTGIALIVGVLGKARAAKIHVVACGLTNHYQEIFEITRLVDFMDIATDEDAALAATTVFGPAGEEGGDDA